MLIKSLQSLDVNARELAELATAWMDPFWDEGAGLLYYPGYENRSRTPRQPRSHLVRDTIWYTVGLLLRRQGTDVLRALHAIDAILDYQLDEAGQPYHGTFLRSPEEPHPRHGAREWRDYDPNWREFIITTLQLILDEFEPLIPAVLVARIDAATRLAVAGALARGLPAGYTNIALMHAFMLAHAGVRLGRPDWLAAGEDMAREVHRLFMQHEAFSEYNSPTYYGVDLYALSLWRGHAPCETLRALGAEMEGLVWTDIARYYHAGLRNLCGPFDRAYGMDMTRYAAVVGEWIWLVSGTQRAPFPEPSLAFAHTPDFCYAPCAAILGTAIPEEAWPHFIYFQGERLVEHTISSNPRRAASAWLEDNLMIGAEFTSRAKPGYVQFHSATAHWRAGEYEVGWLRLRHTHPADATAARRSLKIAGQGALCFEIYAPGLQEGDVSAGEWRLAGLAVRVSGGAAAAFSVSRQLEWLELRYDPGADAGLELVLEFEPLAD